MNGLSVGYSAVAEADFEALLALRIAAMRPSLEQAGRFDPLRARQRFAASFNAAASRSIDLAGQRIGFYTLRHCADELALDHLYLHPAHSGHGVGSMVMAQLIALSRQLGLPLRLGALRGSAANRFYQRHGFVQCGESEWDIHYQRLPDAV